MSELKYLGLRATLGGGAPRIQVATASGRVREVPLSRRDLLAIIKNAAAALEALDKESE